MLSPIALPSRYHGFEPACETGAAPTLAVILHGFASFENSWIPKSLDRDAMASVVRAVREAYGDGEVDIYAPTMPYANHKDRTGCAEIVKVVVTDLDYLWSRSVAGTHGGYRTIVFVGHSMGGVILRRVFLAGAHNSPDYANARDDLYETMKPDGIPRPWAAKVERILLLASWDKGWSVSRRTGWWFGFWLNLIGAFGRASEVGVTLLNDILDIVDRDRLRQPFRTMLDMRQGAPFIVQTRLIWMAYRRWLNDDARKSYNARQPQRRLADPPSDAVNPLVVQIVGSLDDFVPPQEQIDCDAEGLVSATTTGEKKNYFLFEMAGASHAGVVAFDGDADRKAIFIAALKNSREDLDVAPHDTPLGKARREPTHFLDAPQVVHEDVGALAFVMHGIRDDGTWTHRISAAIKREWEAGLPAGELYPTWTHSYGYFPMLPFILPWIRKSKVEWFMDNYVSVKAAYPNATLHYVGHSNGTYLAASALQDYPAARFGNVYFAGSVVHPRYDWATAHERGQIEKLHNARGGEDWVVALLPKSVEYFSDLGGAGFDGFDDLHVSQGRRNLPSAKQGFTQSEKFARGGHSGAITEGHWGEIAKFIVKGEKPFAVGEPDWLFAPRQHRFFRVLGALRVGVPLGFAIAAVLIVLAVLLCQFDHWRIGAFAVTALGGAWLTVAGKVIGGVASAPAVEPKAPETPKPFPSWLLWVLAAGLLILSLLAPGVVAEAGGWAWGGALVAFMVAQYCVERDWRALAARLRAGDRGAALDEWRQSAPQDRTAHALTAVFFILSAVFVVWASFALFFALGVGSGWAVARFFVIVLLLWFVLTRI